MLIVGLTGGIGAGKSVCSTIFECLDVPVYISDIAAKHLLAEDPGVKKAIIDAFGQKSYTSEGLPNRKYLAARVFDNPKNLKKINGIVHPAVRMDFIKWGQSHIDEPYIVQESALIFETGLDQFMDFTILVVAPDDVRIERVMQRDQVSHTEVRQRMDNQNPQEDNMKKADFIIENDGQHSLIRQVLDIHRNLLDEIR